MLDLSDHRLIAQRLDLLHFQEEAPGMVFWHPDGFFLYRQLEDAVRRQIAREGYSEIRTPQILRRPIWEASGHWQHFRDDMFTLSVEAAEAAVKPVSCPGHLAVFGARGASYRDLPLRFAELGLVHRDERSGTLHGLMRLRQFTQDDGHVFCTPEQAPDEVEAFCRGVPPFYAQFGFSSIALVLATRPADRAGDDASWDRAEAALRGVLARLGSGYSEQPGGGAFYGPKIEFVLEDRHGRSWTCATIQYDLVMPQRFHVHYVDAAGQRRHPVMLHRALYGSLERFLGILLEHHAGALPAWLCPAQVLVAPIAEAHGAFAEEVAKHLRDAGMRAAADVGKETLSKRIAEAHERAIPFVCVVGAREAASRSVSVRARDGSQWSLPLGEAVDELAKLCARPGAADGP